MTKRPFSHPLFGSSLSNLFRLLRDNGRVPFKHSPQLLLALLSGVGRWPFSMVEKVRYSKKLSAMKMEAPIFIVGHWRSGTTHLCNLLSQSTSFGIVSPVASGIPHDLLVLGHLFRPWLEKSIPPDRLIDRVPVLPDSPQEDEFGLANMVTNSFLHGLYFPKKLSKNFQKGMFVESWSKKEQEQWEAAVNQYLKKIYLDQGGKQLLVKNPGHSTKIPLLRKMFPGARFIHIYRNPYRVFPSMKNYFNKLLPVLALQPYQSSEIAQVILETYPRIMNSLIEDISGLPPGTGIEIRFESLEADPISQLRQIYSTLEMSGFEQAEPHFKEYLLGIRKYRKNIYHQDPEESSLIRDHWGRFITHYDY